ncbi:MAG: SgcJ/EcaC family oxidoreductase [Steroidobacteraceae bacterium]
MKQQLNVLRAGLALMLVLMTFGARAESDIQQLATRWADAYNAHDRAALGAIYTEDAHLMMHGEPTIKGRKNIEAFWADDFKEGNPLTLLTVTNAVEGIDMMLVHGNYQVIDRKDGRQMGFGRFAHIWNKDKNGQWHLDRDLWNQPYETANGAKK